MQDSDFHFMLESKTLSTGVHNFTTLYCRGSQTGGGGQTRHCYHGQVCLKVLASYGPTQ